MVEWFLNLSISLFALSNGGRRVWATVLFLRAIMHRKVVFSCHIWQTIVCWDAATMATRRNDFSFLDKIASFPGLSLKGGRERTLGTSCIPNSFVVWKLLPTLCYKIPQRRKARPLSIFLRAFFHSANCLTYTWVAWINHKEAICTMTSFYYYDQNPFCFSFHILIWWS